ncbi:MAG: type III-B CRISPR module-associated protein Cmr3 [Candidatus Hydrothermia bacterium]
MLKFKIKPYDVLFFGSGKPFNLGDIARSIFPPFPHTFAGAICSKIYWECKIDITKILKAVYGPFLYNEKDKKIYFPKPADIYTGRKGKGDEIYLLKFPNENYKLFNPNNTNKPNPIEKFAIYFGDEEVEGFDGFISQDGLKEWLNGKIPDKNEIIKFKDIFEYENRVGIKQEMSYHTVVEEDGLYRIDFLRLKDGKYKMENRYKEYDWYFVVWVEFDFDNNELKKANLDENKIYNFFDKEPRSLKLGGEMRSAYYEVEESDIKNLFGEKLEVKEKDTIKILFLTPSTFSNSLGNDILPSINGIKIKSLVSNGFINLAIDSKQLGLNKFVKKALKAGSVIYAEVDNNFSHKSFWVEFLERDKNFIGTNLAIYGKV